MGGPFGVIARLGGSLVLSIALSLHEKPQSDVQGHIKQRTG